MNVSIEKIEIASFGKLKNAIVNIESGVNIMSLPNESGKSTLAAFIKFVFYGFAGARKQSLSENERELYTSWDNGVSEGRIFITADDEKYVVYRKCAPSGKEECEITLRATARPAFSGEVPGEVFFGVGEDIFTRTLFFRQLTLPQTRDDVLADRLRDIAISADEQVSTNRAIKRLSEAKNELKGKMGNGIIPNLERERDLISEQIADSATDRDKSEKLRAEVAKRTELLNTAQKKLNKARAERLNITKYEALLKLQRINRLSVEERLAREDYEQASYGLKQQADGGAFGELSSKQAELVAEKRNCENLKAILASQSAELEAIKNENPLTAESVKQARIVLKRSAKNSKLLFILAAALAVIGLLVYFAVPTPAGFIGVALGLVLGAIGAVIFGKPATLAKSFGLNGEKELRAAVESFPNTEARLKECNARVLSLREQYDNSRLRCLELKKSLDELIAKYADFGDDEDYSAKIENILSRSAASGEKLAVWRAKKQEYESFSADENIEELTDFARGALEPEREKAVVDREIAFYTNQVSQLEELNHKDELEIATLDGRCGDLAVLVGKRDSIENSLTDLTLKHKAYETAIALINESSDYMKSMVAPRIASRADEYFTIATGGKYNGLEVDTRMMMSFGEDFKKSCEFLSAGTRDSAYLSLRLSLADMLFGGNGVPIILDDAFGRIDDNRLRMMAAAIAESAKKHQIIILTHGDRERVAFADIGKDCSEITIRTI